MESFESTVEKPDGATVKAPIEGLARGTALGRYLVLERLGAGAMGVVYGAYDPELDRKVAIKILRRAEGSAGESRRQARFVREAKAIAKLTHQNAVGIFDVGVDDGRVFLAMEYLAGGTLRDWMAAEKRPWREILKMFIEVGHGLAAAHAEGLVHRDFKPDNVLLDRTGTPKVADFGLARLSGPVSAADGESGEISIGPARLFCPEKIAARRCRDPSPARERWPARPRTWRPSSSTPGPSTREPTSSRFASRSTKRSMEGGPSKATRSSIWPIT